MTEEIVKYETAKLARKKGFKILVDDAYFMANDNGEITLGLSNYDEPIYGEIKAPAQSLLQKWLREIHNIDVDVVRDSEVHYQDETRWIVKASNWNDIRVKDFPIAQLKFPNTSNHTDFKSYEEALEKGLIEGLNFIDDEKI
jgi:hypothetical protein